MDPPSNYTSGFAPHYTPTLLKSWIFFLIANKLLEISLIYLQTLNSKLKIKEVQNSKLTWYCIKCTDPFHYNLLVVHL